MAQILYSIEARRDLREIREYSIRRWGSGQTARYIRALKDCFELLARNPGMGRSCDGIRTGLRRMEHGSHVIFYRKWSGGILLVRVLHERMLPWGRMGDGDAPEDQGD